MKWEIRVISMERCISGRPKGSFCTESCAFVGAKTEIGSEATSRLCHFRKFWVSPVRRAMLPA